LLICNVHYRTKYKIAKFGVSDKYLYYGIYFASSNYHRRIFRKASGYNQRVKLAMQQDQLLTKEGALKMAGISNAVFMKAINDGIVKPQLVKGRKKAMYLESEVLKIEKKKRGS
jgi:hypothetical protein